MKKISLKQAISDYRGGKISAWKAAELAGVSLRKMMNELSRRGVPSRLSDRDLKDELAVLKMQKISKEIDAGKRKLIPLAQALRKHGIKSTSG